VSKGVPNTCAASENHAPRNIAVSNASAISAHPHRSEDEARVVNNPPQPVELAITADDSSEEIVMSWFSEAAHVKSETTGFRDRMLS
jgi:hypothetical protein